MNAIILVGHHFTLQYTGTQLTHAGVLLQQGASTKIKDKRGQTPLDYIPLWENEEAIRLLEQY